MSMPRLLLSSLLLLLAATLSGAWPDGAPCVTNAYESMNPLEAVEHHGGLQLDEPPYEIKVDQRCYWRSQPIAFTLQGKNESIWYKGFAIQPFEWFNGNVHGKRMGRLLRLDDNGSWQYQCFRFKDSATHSHNQRKKQIKMWWRNDEDDDRVVQLVATVVHSQRRFWVKSVLSPPIPPCRERRDIPWTPPMPTMPPPPKTFKMETDREFGNFFINEDVPDAIQKADNFVKPTFPNFGSRFGATSSPMTARPSFTTPTPSFAFTFQQQQERARQQEEERRRTLERQRQMEEERARNAAAAAAARQRAEAARQQQLRAQTAAPTTQPVRRPTVAPTSPAHNSNCADIDPPSRCLPWAQYCAASTYMHQNCKKSCNFC